MNAKRWGIAAVATVIVLGSTVVGSPAAHADPGAPAVTSVDRSGAQPVITIDWGAHADAPVGVIESVDGYKLGTPSDMATVVDDWGTSPGLRSYRAAACYAQCDLDSITSGQATLVQGDWLRPDVSSATSEPAPDLFVQWYQKGFQISWGRYEAGVDPAVAVYKDGVPLALVRIADAGYYEDDGPFDASVTYAITVCHADCTLAALASGFAQQTAFSPEHTETASTSAVPTHALWFCPSDWDFLPPPMVVNTPITCSAHVWNSEFALEPPTGTVDVFSDNDSGIAPTSCVLQNNECVVTLTPSELGTHALTSSYPGDDTHTASEFSWDVSVVTGITTTSVACPSVVHPGETIHCEFTVTDTTSGGSVVPTGTIDVDSGSYIPQQRCTLQAGRCSVDITLPLNFRGNLPVLASYTPDDGHAPSSGAAVIPIVDQMPSATSLSCVPGSVAPGDVLFCSATVTDLETGGPIQHGSVVIQSGQQSMESGTCDLNDSGQCTVTFEPPSDAAAGPMNVTASFEGTFDALPSADTTTVVVTRHTALVAKPAIANLVSPTRVNLKMSATLTDALDHAPIAGETVRFAVNGTTLCTGVTDASGVATCSGLADVAQAANGYKAVFDGNASSYRLKSSASGSGIRL